MSVEEVCSRVFSTFRRVHRNSPPWLQRIYIPLFRWRYWSIWRSWDGLRLSVTVVRGVNKDGEQFSIAYVDMWPKRQFAWNFQFFEEESQHIDCGRVFILSLRRFLLRRFSDCAVIIAKDTQFMNAYSKYILRRVAFRLPTRARLGVDIDRPIKSIRKNAKDGIADAERRIRKFNLQYEVTRDLTRFENFYRTMHIPFINKRHKDAARLSPEDSVWKNFENSDLLLIKKDDEVISGITILRLNDSTAEMRIIGVKDGGDPKYLSFGAIGACYYFSILEAQKKGYKILSFGGIDPVLTQPMTRFKRKLNAEFLPTENITQDCHMMLPLDVASSGFRSFLLHNPFICIGKKELLHRSVFVESGGEDSEVKLRKHFSSTEVTGIPKTRVFAIEDSSIKLLLEFSHARSNLAGPY